MILASCYTREAGVRDLERKLGAVCRFVAVNVAERRNVGVDNDVDKVHVSNKDLI